MAYMPFLVQKSPIDNLPVHCSEESFTECERPRQAMAHFSASLAFKRRHLNSLVAPRMISVEARLPLSGCKALKGD